MRFFGGRRGHQAGRDDSGDQGRKDAPDEHAWDEAGGTSGTPLDDAALHASVESLLLRELGGTMISDIEHDKIPTPLHRARVLEWIADAGYSYFLDAEGDVGGLWHGRLFYFLLFGSHHEILQVRGQWNRDITIERLEEILEFCNEWNADRIWPKAYTRVRDNGMVHVFTEVTVDLEHGVNDDQLDQLLQCGLSTGSMFFDALDEFYPDPARSAP
ncbi:YbjN domain-containing protein [Oerskovia sp. KBS0722]|uniref:YbjN domain-containing protein n=1 Tax=Oerskovia sp. KBS0722 TaxID=1179673 RepID=UPI001FEDA366|nr:YbjN domain-containing protein [Oerskovia sp. KBS0722]